MAPEILENGELRKGLADILRTHQSELEHEWLEHLQNTFAATSTGGRVSTVRYVREPIKYLIEGISTGNYERFGMWEAEVLDGKERFVDPQQVFDSISFMSNLFQNAIGQNLSAPELESRYRGLIKESMRYVSDRAALKLKQFYSQAKPPFSMKQEVDLQL